MIQPHLFKHKKKDEEEKIEDKQEQQKNEKTVATPTVDTFATPSVRFLHQQQEIVKASLSASEPPQTGRAVPQPETTKIEKECSQQPTVPTPTVHREVPAILDVMRRNVEVILPSSLVTEEQFQQHLDAISSGIGKSQMDQLREQSKHLGIGQNKCCNLDERDCRDVADRDDSIACSGRGAICDRSVIAARSNCSSYSCPVPYVIWSSPLFQQKSKNNMKVRFRLFILRLIVS